jgi:WD40 repeat protein
VKPIHSILMLILVSGSVRADGPADVAGKNHQHDAALYQENEQNQQGRLDLFGDPLPEGAAVRLGTVRLRHNEIVYGVAYAPDGKTIASISRDGAIRIWDADSGKPVKEMRTTKHGDTRNLAFSPDSSKLITSDAKSAGMWDIRAGKLLFETKEHAENVSGLVFSPDGHSFASAGGNIVIWDTKTGEERFTFDPPGKNRDGHQGLAFSPDGKLLAASREQDVHVWDIATGASRLAIPEAYERDVIFTIFQNNSTLITGEWGHIRIWDITTGKQIREFDPKGTDYGASIVLSPNSKFLARAASNKIEILEVATGHTVKELSDYRNGYGPATHHMAFSPDGKYLIAKADDNVIHKWDLETAKRLLTFDDAHSSRLRAATFSPNGQYLLTAGDRTARLWEASGKQLRLFQMGDEQAKNLAGDACACLSPDGKWIAAGGFDFGRPKGMTGVCRIWDTATGKMQAELRLPARVSHVSFAADCKRVAIAAGMDPEKKASIGIWDFLDKTTWAKMADLKFPIDAMAFSSSGKQLNLAEARFTGQSSFHLWDARYRQERLFALPPQTVRASFSNNGQFVIASQLTQDSDNSVSVHETITGQLMQYFRVPNTFASTVAVSPAARLVATSESLVNRGQPFVHVWDLDKGVEITKFPTGSTEPHSLVFSENGESLIAGMENGSALVWSLKGLKRGPATPIGHEDLGQLWDKLRGDARVAQQAVRRLSAAAEAAVPYLKKVLRPVPTPDEPMTKGLIVELSSDNFTKRQAALKKSKQIGPQLGPLIQKTLNANPDLETRRRLEQILNSYADIPSPETLRTIRAIMVLESIGTLEARNILETLARGATEARETEEAQAALSRLTRQKI